ncbi:MAG: glycosyltransferase family 9 protein [Isosphaeraceae bacterium]
MHGSRIDLTQLRPERVCLIKPSSLGDIVHALPVLSALRRQWPDARMAWVVNTGLRSLLDGHPDLDEVIPFDRAGFRLSPGGLAKFGRFLADLRRRRFDVTIDLQGLLRSGIMTAATGAKVRIGQPFAREGADQFYNHRLPPVSAEMHAVDRLLKVAEAFGADVSRPRFALATSIDDRRWARDVLSETASPRLVLNMGARWPTKRWPPSSFAALARRAVEERGASLIAVGAPEDRPLVEQLRTDLGSIPVLDLCGKTTLPQLAALSAEADVFLSNDTGPLHLAAAAGARTVGVYTCTSPRATGPYGPRSVAVETCVACAASYLTRCQRLDCMTELSPERVWPALLGQLDRASEFPNEEHESRILPLINTD